VWQQVIDYLIVQYTLLSDDDDDADPFSYSAVAAAMIQINESTLLKCNCTDIYSSSTDDAEHYKGEIILLLTESLS
jgi:hypothetical protein